MKMRTMDLCLIICSVLLIAFTVVMIITYYKFYAIPDTLCTCFFGAIAGECGCLGWIKTTKERVRERQWQKEDYKDFQSMEENKND